jgi:hypothetical protein
VEGHGRAMQDTDENKIRRMRLARWIPQATDTHSEHSIIIAFPRQKMVTGRRLTMLHYTYIASLILMCTICQPTLKRF